MSAPFLIIRADANSRMGTGHVMRCIALGQAWQDAGGNVVFVSCCDSETLKQRIDEESFRLIELPEAHPHNLDDLSRTVEVAWAHEAKWVVTDGYHFDLPYQEGIRAAGFKLLCVDDYNHLPVYEADILLNQNIRADELAYRCNQDCRQLMGLRFVMLRREFRRAQQRIRSGPPRNILITMGGSDPDNASLQVLEALALLDFQGLYITVLVGPANRLMDVLQRFASSATIDCQLLNSVEDMPSLMNWADFAITAAGSTCWELAAMGVPLVSVVLAENQERIAKCLADTMQVRSIGWVDSSFQARCAEMLPKCLSMHGVGSVRDPIAGVDRFGVDRVLQKPAKECGLDLFKGRLILRPIEASDTELLLEWANDIDTRANSFNCEQISLESHLDWLAGRLNNPNVLMFMLTLDGTPSGHIRYELDDAGDALLSFVVAPEFRGMGLGDRLVELSRKEVVMSWKGCRIKAYTIAANRASAAILEQRGFVRHEAEPNQSTECKLYYWSQG